MFLIVCGLQKHMAQLERIVYKVNQNLHATSFFIIIIISREFVSSTWSLSDLLCLPTGSSDLIQWAKRVTGEGN